ncbi:ventral expressed homeobox [Dunckerocampus dactyliophorus]|uniref:ventral expressed homeobox n=1 Tax=Dunckerocampus dactyliophorus TaxID=161453 RepID=UPI00240695D3|nr:ventral expressed homeobox [Dunckerocampus dactyliophorus]
MANFSAEWLSQSFYSKDSNEEPRYPPSSPNSCGDASGSESEVGDDSEGEAAQQRRMRTKFSSEQINKLESTFSQHKYLGASQRRKLAENLNLAETQVKTWFQNRRMKLKREVQELRHQFLLLPPALFQHHAARGQFHHSPAVYAPLQTLQGPPHHVFMTSHYY